MRSLFALYYMERDLAEFLEHGHLSQAQAILLRQQARVLAAICLSSPPTAAAIAPSTLAAPPSQVRALLEELRPQAVALVDAWGMRDAELNSALGRYDGRVYEALMVSAQQEPLNTDRPVGGWQALLLPRSRM